MLIEFGTIGQIHLPGQQIVARKLKSESLARQF